MMTNLKNILMLRNGDGNKEHSLCIRSLTQYGSKYVRKFLDSGISVERLLQMGENYHQVIL